MPNIRVKKRHKKNPWRRLKGSLRSSVGEDKWIYVLASLILASIAAYYLVDYIKNIGD